MKEFFKDSQINHTQEILKWLIVSKNVDYYQILLKENNAYLDFNVFSGPRWRWCGCTTLVLFHFFLSSAGILSKVFPFWTWRLLLPGNSVAFPVQKEPTVLVAKWWHHIQHATYTFLGGQRSLEKGVKRLKNNQKKLNTFLSRCSLSPHYFSSHVSPHPAGMESCNQDIVSLEVLSLTASQHVQRRLLANSKYKCHNNV